MLFDIATDIGFLVIFLVTVKNGEEMATGIGKKNPKKTVLTGDYGRGVKDRVEETHTSGLFGDRGSNPSDSDALSTSPPEPKSPPLSTRPRPLGGKSDTKGTNSGSVGVQFKKSVWSGKP